MKRIFYVFIVFIIVAGCKDKTETTSQVLERSTPEAEGVSSQGIIDFINAVEENDLEVHSFMFLRHGKVIAEGWWKPYGPEYRHLMYSASKSITSLGIGIAADEGRLNITDKVISFFPEYVTDSIGENMKLLTVRDLLTMSVGQEQDPAYMFMRGSEDWIRGFLYTEPVHTPGTVWMYNNFATFMLSAILQKVTGQMLFNYLEPRLFEPLDIKAIEWDYNNQGITLGMIGSRLHTEDLAKLGQLALQKGRWGNKQIVSEAYIEEASKLQISNNNENKPDEELSDGEKGYGFQYWRGSHNSFRMDGMAGQFVFVLPDYDAVIVLTSNVGNTQLEMDQVWNHLIPAMKDEPLPADAELNEKMAQVIASLDWAPKLNTNIDESFKNDVSGKEIELDENRMGIKNITLTFENENCEFDIERENADLSIVAGIGSWEYSLVKSASLSSAGGGGLSYQRQSNEVNRDMRNLKKVAATCGFKDENTFILNARFIEESLGDETWEFKFTKSGDNSEVEITPGAGGSRASGGQPTVLKGKIID